MKYLNIEVVTGGFVLSYSVERLPVGVASNVTGFNQEREAFTSQSKLTKRVKELLDGYASSVITPTDDAKDVE